MDKSLNTKEGTLWNLHVENKEADPKNIAENGNHPEDSLEEEEDINEEETNEVEKKKKENTESQSEKADQTNSDTPKDGNDSPKGPINNGNEKGDGRKKVLKKVGWFALKTAAISGLVIGGTTVALPLIGFGALGPISGSLAALYQSSVLGGTIASGSAFATLQSVGMVGLSAAAQTGIVAGSAAVSGGHTLLRKNNDDGNNNDKKNKDDKHNDDNKKK